MYWEAITQIEAQDVLIKLKLADYPHMKQHVRESMFNKFNAMAYPNEWQKTYTTIEDVMRQING